jgi:prephenate dehydrogenase
VGLGLIGGSAALRLAAAHDVVGWDTDPETRRLAERAGLRLAGSAAQAAAGADVAVLASPAAAVPATLAVLAATDCRVVTDVGSVKAPVLAAARAAGLTDRYVGGHPMAGVERSGFAAADPELLAGAVWVLTLEEDTDLDRWLTVAELVTAAGCRVLPASAAAHDEAQARVSGLPHLLATALAVAGGAGGPLAAALAAGSLRDGTRVAGSRPEFVAALCDGNRAALAGVLAETLADLSDARAALAGGGTVQPLAAAGHAARRAWAEPAPTVRVTVDRATATLRPELLALGAAGGTLDAVTPREVHGRRPDVSGERSAGRFRP